MPADWLYLEWMHSAALYGCTRCCISSLHMCRLVGGGDPWRVTVNAQVPRQLGVADADTFKEQFVDSGRMDVAWTPRPFVRFDHTIFTALKISADMGGGEASMVHSHFKSQSYALSHCNNCVATVRSPFYVSLCDPASS